MKLSWLAIAFLLVSVPLLQPLAAAGATPTLSSVNLGTVPRGVAVDSNSGTIYAVLYLNGTTLALNPQTLATVAKIPTPSPYAVAVNSVTDRVYVSQGQGGSLSVIDGSNNNVAATVGGLGTPYALAVDEEQNLVFAADTGGNTLWIVNGSNNAVAAHLAMGSTSALAVDPAAREAFVGNLTNNSQSGEVIVVNTTSLSVSRTFPVAVPPSRFTVDPSSHLLFISSENSGAGDNFVAIDDLTLQLIYSIHLGGAPNIIAVAPPDVYVSDVGLNRLYEIDGATGQVLFNSTGGSNGITFTGITSMAYDNLTGRLYITENDVTSLIVLSPGSASTSLDDSAYLLLAVPALAAGVAGLLAIYYIRRRTRSAAARTVESNKSDVIHQNSSSNRAIPSECIIAPALGSRT
ncbi:MAG: YncE family protein [Thaumarchaeota archaeon]|nr:YncE family protein [Nitrososphaerota archaeon]